MARDSASPSRRRALLRGGAGLIALASGAQAAALAPEQAPRRLRIIDSTLARTAQAEGNGPQGPFRTSEFDMVGVFDMDWLLDARYARLLDTMAASPGAFGAVRVFGALNSGEREDVFPTSSGHVWPRTDTPMGFSTTLDALSALTARGLVPFLPLTFFPAAVSASPIEPPGEFGAWQDLVRGFLDRLADRFGTAEIGRWWFEVWNEPNMPPFWRGDFDRYLDLYRATSAAVLASGHEIRLGGPALAYMPPREGETLMERFLDFLHREPRTKCDFLSFHRKGIWVSEEALPKVERLVAAAETTAEQALRLVPERCLGGLPIVNNEADMKVGFATPYEPRLTEQFPAWLAAVTVAHDALSARYAERGLRFLAAADNANQHLVREPFDGRRSLMTPTLAAPDDLMKLPVFAFYEMLRLLGDRHGSWTVPGDAFSPASGLFHLMTVAEDRIGALFTHYPAEGSAARPIAIDHVLEDIPWPWINLVEFRIDGAHSNAYTAAGRRMPMPVEASAAARRIREAQELGVAAPIRHRIRVERGRTRLTFRLEAFATALVWVTPFDPAPPAPPHGLEAEPKVGNVLLRWAPHRDGAFYSYELHRSRRGGRGTRISPMPLRAATWVDTAPAPGEYRYALRVVSASGIRSAAVRGPLIQV